MLGKIYTNIKSFKALQFINLYKIDEYIKNNDIPTLLIGKKELVEKGFTLSVLNRQIDNNLYWTYTKMEKRNIHETDVNSFYEIVFKKLYRDIKHTNISIYTMKYSILKNIINILNDENLYKCIYIKKNHIDDAIKNDPDYINIAVLTYKLMPCRRMLRYIKKINIDAGLEVERQISKKK